MANFRVVQRRTAAAHFRRRMVYLVRFLRFLAFGASMPYGSSGTKIVLFDAWLSDRIWKCNICHQNTTFWASQTAKPVDSRTTANVYLGRLPQPEILCREPQIRGFYALESVFVTGERQKLYKLFYLTAHYCKICQKVVCKLCSTWKTKVINSQMLAIFTKSEWFIERFHEISKENWASFSFISELQFL